MDRNWPIDHNFATLLSLFFAIDGSIIRSIAIGPSSVASPSFLLLFATDQLINQSIATAHQLQFRKPSSSFFCN